MSRRKGGFKQVGVTEDGRPAFAGLFRMMDTHGMPLHMVLDFFQDNALVPCWISFYEDGIKAGWKPSTIELRMEEAIVDSYGKSHWEEVKKRLDEYKLGRKPAT